MATPQFTKVQQKPVAKSLVFNTIFHPNISLVLPNNEKVIFKDGKYIAKTETEAGMLEKHFSNAVRRA